jgi:hypothetical protein
VGPGLGAGPVVRMGQLFTHCGSKQGLEEKAVQAVLLTGTGLSRTGLLRKGTVALFEHPAKEASEYAPCKGRQLHQGRGNVNGPELEDLKGQTLNPEDMFRPVGHIL